MKQNVEHSFPNPREKVLDRFVTKYLFETGVDGKTAYERFCDENALSKEVKEHIDFIVKKITNQRMGVLKSVDYDSFLKSFRVLFSDLSGREEFSEVLNVLGRIYVLLLSRSDGTDVGSNLERMISVDELIKRYVQADCGYKDIANACIRSGPRVLQKIEQRIDEVLLTLGARKYVIAIVGQSQGADKLEKILSQKETLAEFNGYHLSQIVVGAGWEEKLKYFTNADNIKKLKELGFEAAHLSQIVRSAGWEEKLRFVMEHPEKIRAVFRDKKISLFCEILDKKDWRNEAGAFLRLE